MLSTQGLTFSVARPIKRFDTLAIGGTNYVFKKRIVAAVLCLLLGAFGIHRFYVGKIGTGILQLFTLGGLGFWALFDLIMILCGKFTDKQGDVDPVF
jgi:hypothetical protein